MKIEQINKLTQAAYDRIAEKYHQNFKDEMTKKEYDQMLLNKFSKMLENNSLVLDAGCGPSGQIGAYLFQQGHQIIGIDISPRCIEIAMSHNPSMKFQVMDMMHTTFDYNLFDGIISFYSIIYTPKKYINKLFAEFYRILQTGGKLLLAVKKGMAEGISNYEFYEGNPVYFTYFQEEEIKTYLQNNLFRVDLLETRKSYDFEIDVDRIYAIGIKQ